MAGYTGFKVTPSGSSASVDQLKVADATPERFWKDYVSQRKPVLLDGLLTDSSWKAGEKWTNAYLAEHAGSCDLRVEVRPDTSEHFGRGIKTDVTFKDFLSRMDAADETLYLTTQKVPCASDGHPALFGPPLSHLKSDIPTQPHITGLLIPQAINLWMGCTRSGSTSGLHHDFHDNLYVLLRGRKRFRLWDPSHAPHMPTVGRVSKIHANGRIVYKGQEDTLADGSSAGDVSAWRARTQAEARVAQAEQGVRDNTPGAQEALASAEEALEQLLESELEAAISTHPHTDTHTGAEGDSDGDIDMTTVQDDYVGSEDEENMSASQSEDSDSHTDSDRDNNTDTQPTTQGANTGRRGLGEGRSKQTQQATKVTKKGGKGSKEADAGKAPEPDPPSFCPGVDMSLTDSEIKKRFPTFPGRDCMLEVWVEAGQMLYLPAGRVTRASQRKEQQAQAQGSKPESVSAHMALNYWFHPPDGTDFDKPYTSDYWPSLWRARCTAWGIKPASTDTPTHPTATTTTTTTAHAPPAPHPVLVKRSSFEQVRVDELAGATGHDPHRGAHHHFQGVKVDEKDGATGHDPHRGPRHSFDGVKVDEKDGATGHDPHRGPRHSFGGVKVDELAGAVGQDPHRGAQHGVHVEQKEGGHGFESHTVQHTGDTGPTESTMGMITGQVEVHVAQGGGGGGRKGGRKGAAPKRLGAGGDHLASAPKEDAAPPATAPATDADTASPAAKKRRKGRDEQAGPDAAAGPGPGKDNGDAKGKERHAKGAQGGKGTSEQGVGVSEGGAKKNKKDKRASETDTARMDGDEDDDGGLMQGEDGELGEMVATGLREYFESEEGRGAWKLALGKYMLEAFAKEGLSFGDDGDGAGHRRRRSARSRGRRHHRVVRVARE